MPMGSTTTLYEDGITILKTKGLMRAKDFIDWAISNYSEKENNPLLVDLTDSQLDVTTEDMKLIARVTVIYTKHRPKTAYLTAKNPTSYGGSYPFGLTRQYEAIARLAGATNQMDQFTDRDEAIAWLKA
jgi:hypothetical protein